ncbi:ERCC4 domain-containing protein [Clostridium saccharobutylicum]|uniref:ERCC4 domain-containing protein n=1 Tax=Clostridium saccharobutylicum DSM 13864 TaxID=1345695 RepID=U5MTS8_CLOSA|nr:ERCC4 domain-containing protein [Clostridium saccharobutylicum]AGX43980.1 hypothetical protein CLSA_c30130 [Clostridium saccharobutylicum DSM 13864]AQR91276.1 hypothetical protein CLOSC_30000 [Clostridium saccharobutylicum]AQS01180.1 hypothetical protein CSACC_30070 [Clostridium saccharobutylicum]AQS15163.1 hypothetical protein CLOSACC_30070 [Clostridium saccharobutylicum]MBA2905290.1 hypothetical protein [Clostridium saccharobutylicum]
MRYRFTDKEIDRIQKNLTILTDTREQSNSHIIRFLDSKKINHKSMKLDYGDYSIMLPANSFKGQQRDIYFTNDIVIERKFCIDEIAMNFKDKKTNINEVNKEIVELLGKEYLAKVLKSDYNRFKQELTGINKNGIEFFIFIEDKNFDENIRQANYRSQYDPQSLYGRIKSLEREFRTIIRPIGKECMGSEIFNTLKYGVRNKFVHEGYIDEFTWDVVNDYESGGIS